MLEKKLPYKQKVYEIIKKEILNGHYAPGDVLNERRLSEELGISRTPIREALQMLEQDQWLKMEIYKGAVVREFDLKYMQDIGQIRKALETCAIEAAIEHITEEDIEKLEQIQNAQRKMVENFDVVSYIQMDRQFHVHIYDMSRNQELIHLLRNYYDIFRFLGTQAVMNTSERRITTLAEHQSVLDALKKRDVVEAVKAMRYHMESTEQNMYAHLKQHSDAEAEQK